MIGEPDEKPELKFSLFKNITENNKLSHLLNLLFLTVVLCCAQFHLQNLISIEEKLRIGYHYFYLLIIFVFFQLLPNPKEQGHLRFLYKLLHAAAATYLLHLLFMCILDRETLKGLLIMVDPVLAQPVVGRNYSIDCRLYTPENPSSKIANIMGTMDVFISAHFFGWLVKTLVYRNNIIVWTLSIGFEVLELSLKQYLPNFHECWWDHLLLDLFGCNLLGILVGNWLIKKLGMRRYHWFFEPNEESEKKSYFQRLTYFFTSVERYVSNHEWHFLSSPENFLTVMWILASNFIVELSHFFNKAVLNLPANHWLLAIRIFTVGFTAISAMSELYDFTRIKQPEKQFGTGLVIFHMIIVAEVVIFLNNYPEGFFNKETPASVKLFWGGCFGVILMMFIYSLSNSRRKMVKQ